MADKPLQAGDLDRKIDILFYEEHRGTAGSMGKSLSPLATGVWAKVDEVQGDETEIEDRSTAALIRDFTVRYRTDVASTMVVRYEGIDYSIIKPITERSGPRKQWSVIRARAHD